MPKAVGGMSFSDVPPPSRSSKKSKLKQYEYNTYLAVLNHSEVGVLELDPSDNVRSVKVSLRKAAQRMGFEIQTWDSNGKVYFRKAIGGTTRTSKPRSMREIRRAEGQPDIFGNVQETDDEDEDDEDDDEEDEEEVVL